MTHTVQLHTGHIHGPVWAKIEPVDSQSHL